MRELDVPGEFDCVTIFCDSLNYVLQEDGVQKHLEEYFIIYVKMVCFI